MDLKSFIFKPGLNNHCIFQGGTLDWTKTLQGTILGSFFWGYLVGQIPAGWLATRFGGKWIFGVTMLISSICTLLTPVLAQASEYALIFVRVVLGVVTVSVSFRYNILFLHIGICVFLSSWSRFLIYS